ncbi:MAG TPA: hypothetical protein VEO19_08025 [Terriglobia bacterium]|nr:hypothetical protein [Terriglobia bacterium]
METFLLAVTALATVVGTIGGLILQHRANQHFSEQNRIMIEQAGKEPSKSELKAYKPPKWPLLVMGLMVLGIWIAVIFDYYDRHHAPPATTQVPRWDNYKLKQRAHIKYFNETVELDGYEYLDTTFENVTFMYEGTAPTRLTDVHFTHLKTGETTGRIGSHNPLVKQTLLVMQMLTEVSGCKSAIFVRPEP